MISRVLYWVIIFVFLFLAVLCSGQDILVTIDGEVFKGHQVELTDKHLKFKEAGSESETLVFSRSSLFTIQYENGDKLVFNQINISNVETPTKNRPSILVPAFTKVSIYNVNPINSSALVLNQEIPFKVEGDVIVDDKVIIADGTPVLGIVTKLESPGFFGKPGKLEIKVKQIEMTNRDQLPLIEDIYLEGKDKSTEVVILGAAVFLPILLIKGKEVVIESETPMYVESRVDSTYYTDLFLTE